MTHRAAPDGVKRQSLAIAFRGSGIGELGWVVLTWVFHQCSNSQSLGLDPFPRLPLSCRVVDGCHLGMGHTT